MNKKLHLYTIMPLDTDHIDEICEDIREQYESGVASCALFKMTLVPEGNPPVDKVGIMCEKFDLFRDRLSEMGFGCGVLVQASIGHGWVLSEMFPYQQFTPFNGSEPERIVCPYDEGFREYIKNVFRVIASHHPDTIMLDDDFRLMSCRTGGACACPLHLDEFNRRAGTSFTREQLWDAVHADSEDAKMYSDIFVSTQRDSLLECAKLMREGIDEVDPTIPGSFCCVGNNAECADEIACIMAGMGNPVVVRINNGNYTPAGARFFSTVFLSAAQQIAKLKDKVDVILAETDTCPQNRYSTGAMSLHTHFTGTIIEGAKGAKHWITRLSAFEPESGKAYRKVLGSHEGFYTALADIVPTLRWRGFRIPVTNEANFSFTRTCGGDSAWSRCVIERFGLPMYFSAENGGILCLEGDADADISDEKISQAFTGPVFLSSDAALRLIRRGFADDIGVEVRPWHGKQPSNEKLNVNANTCAVQREIMELVPLKPGVLEDSVVYHTVDNVNIEKLFPGTTVYRNNRGGIAFVFCGTPRANYNIVEAFSFLNYSRKQQFINMMKMAGELPVYYPGDEEMYFRAADMPDGGLFCGLFNIGLDPIGQIELVCERKPSRIEYLYKDGTRRNAEFSFEDDRTVVNLPCFTLDPVILFIY